ncbi:hypothetical protein PTNB73_01360 [Pyrenophora teres f. teres]|nr:hypothetical protein PTNB85_00045 [Pyrenophora teres f. teres]KAE8852344.1 hypothetical protein HRS9122_02631 [Pyrenophora teres f. teres]KAE8874728.1 hypothetical protein PTNB73_01360 [Pyrenophora teres f. teres]
MTTANSLQLRFAQALQNQQDQGTQFCPYPGHGGHEFQDLQEFLDHARIDHRSDFEGLDTLQSRAKLRELSKQFRSDHWSVATEGDRSAPDIGGLTLESEKASRRASPTSGRKRSAPTEHEFTGRKGKVSSHAELAGFDHSKHVIVPDQLPKSQDPRLFDSSRCSIYDPTTSKLASPHLTNPKLQQPQYQPDVVQLQHTDSRYPALILQPDSRAISQEELVSEVKSIYAGLTMVESKCMHVDQNQATAAAQEGESRTNLASDHWQALIALHRTLLHEHHDFFLASQHPSSSPALRYLAGKYSMPARMWKHGIHSFLELLRRHLPASIDHMLAFIYLAYQMVALLYETVPAFEDTWIECLGDLGRYRMAIEDEDYVKAANKNPTVGRLYHHLAILARSHPLLQMYYYSRSLTSVKPFQSARDSIKILLDPIVEKARQTTPDGRSNEENFIFAHALQFEHSSIEDDMSGFLKAKADFTEKLDITIGRVTKKWKDLGVYVAVANIAGWFNYGEDKISIRHAFLQQLYPPSSKDVAVAKAKAIAAAIAEVKEESNTAIAEAVAAAIAEVKEESATAIAGSIAAAIAEQNKERATAIAQAITGTIANAITATIVKAIAATRAKVEKKEATKIAEAKEKEVTNIVEDIATTMAKAVAATITEVKEKGTAAIADAIAAAIAGFEEKSEKKKDEKNERDKNQEKDKKKEQDEEKKIPILPGEWEKEVEEIESTDTHFKHARRLTHQTSAIVFSRLGDNNVLPYVHVTLAFLYNAANSKYLPVLINDAPWAELVAFLNTLIRTEIRQSQLEKRKQDINMLLAAGVFPHEGERDDELPLPEDHHIRGLSWAQHFPEKWFEREHDEEKRYLESASTAKNRRVRILRLAFSICKSKPLISYSKDSHSFKFPA